MIEELELVEALLMAQGEPNVADLSDDALVRFALGWTNEAEEEEILAALVRSDELRERLIEARLAIESNLKRPISELEGGSFQRTLRALVGDALGAFRAPRSASGGVAAPTILRALARSAADRPLLPATVRSGGRTRFSLGPEGPEGTLSIEASSDDSPHLILRAEPGETLGNRPLAVMYDGGDSSIAIAELHPTGSEARIDLGLLGWAGDRLHPRMFRLVREAEGPRWAETIRAESLVYPSRKFRARLAASPRIEGGTLVVEPIVPEAVVLETEKGFVELGMLVGTADVSLAVQSVPAAEGLIRFEVEALGVPDGEFACLEVFSLRFKPEAESRREPAR